ncbi:MAG TPA: Gfo/Idh/MocA family oxidoreductase [Planctomycetota bacterium]|nr:Gfo/Idh/MocA family oxidoreductase [Planctomycetota bacterium]
MLQTPSRTTRRGALRTLAAGVAAPWVVPRTALGAEGKVAPSDRVTMGFIGVGGQGGGHLAGGAWTYLPGGYLGRDDVQILAVCDVWRNKRDAYTKRVNDHYASKFGKDGYKACQAYVDFRDVLARPDIDAVLIGTPVHWHALMRNMAARAGKDVYCEKPISLIVREGRAMAEAVRRYGRVYQAGTQQRSEYGGKFRLACELARCGRLGELKCVYAMLGGGGWTDGGPAAATGRPVPDGFDWDLYLGPVPWRPFDGHADAHRFGWGSINWGQHHYDIVQWGINADDTGPVEIGWEEGKLAYRYASGVVVYGCPYPGERVGGTGGCTFVGTKGRVAVDREHIVSYPPEILNDPPRRDESPLYYSNSHSANFLDCVRTRKRTICDAETGHRAMSIILLGGIAEKLRRPLKFDPQKEQFLNDPEADRMLSAPCREPWRL